MGVKKLFGWITLTTMDEDIVCVKTELRDKGDNPTNPCTHRCSGVHLTLMCLFSD